MSGLDILRKGWSLTSGAFKEYPLQSGVLLGQIGLAGGSAAMTQKGYQQTLKRADRIRQLGAMDRQLAAIDATRRLSTIKASNASPGYANLGVRGSYGSPVDALMYAEAAELKTLERMEMAHRYLVKDVEEDAKLMRQSGFFAAGQTLLGGAANYGANVSLADIRQRTKTGVRIKGTLYDAPEGFERAVGRIG